MLSERMAEIQEALDLGKTIDIKYFSLIRGEVTERKVIPKKVLKQDGRDYLVGYCYLREEERFFRIDGILRLEISGQGAKV